MAEEESKTDFLNLSDEDFEKFGMYSPEESTEEEVEVEDEIVEDVEEESEQQQDDDSDNDEDEDESSQGEAAELDVDDGESLEQDEIDTETVDEDSEDEPVDAQSFYDAITAPIKANGKEITVSNAQEAIQLIQMGANYNSKMAKLKPARQVLKTLEAANMMDEGKIGLAVDLLSGNKEAILQLMKDNNIDPLELDTSEDTGYKPTTRIATSQSVDFDDALDSIKDSQHYDATVSTIQNWDRKSQTEVTKDPTIMKHIETQMSSGVYDVVSGELEKLKALGDNTISGMSDLEAYVAVGNLLNQQGKLTPLKAQDGGSTTKSGRKVQPKAGSRVNPKTQSLKKGAGVPRNKPPKKSSTDNINPLALSDEEFDKVMAKYL